MIRDLGSKFNDYSISPKIRYILTNFIALGLQINRKRFF